MAAPNPSKGKRKERRKSNISPQIKKTLLKVLERVYYNYGKGGALQNTPSLLLEAAKNHLREGEKTAGRPPRFSSKTLIKQLEGAAAHELVSEFLSKQPSYTVHRRIQKEHFPRRKILVPGPRNRLEADLLELRDLKDWNSGYQYALIVIDAFTRKVWAEPLKRKDSPTVSDAFQSLYNEESHHLQSNYLYTDSGREFTGNPFQNLMNKLGIQHRLATAEEFHCPFVERVIRTIKEKLFQAMTTEYTKRWIDLLPLVISTYNKTPHSSLGGKLTPEEACDPANYLEALTHTYPADEIVGLGANKKSAVKYLYKKGDLVRIKKRSESLLPSKGYLPNFTWEIFRIRERANTRPQDRHRGPPAYILEDLNGEIIEHSVFYEPELVRVHVSQLNALSPIREILGRRKKKDSGYELLVWFHGEPKSKARWMAEKGIKGLEETGAKGKGNTAEY